MKFLINSLIILLVTFTLGACSVSKEARSMKKTINGDWILQNVNTEGITSVAKTTIFNEAEYGCFIGSEWSFNYNNSMGSYTLVDKKGSCVPLKRFIRWTIYEGEGQDKEFQFKRLDDKRKSIDNGNGFRLQIIEISEGRMKLKSELKFGGHVGAIIYDFVKK